MSTCDRCGTAIEHQAPAEQGAIASLIARLCTDCQATVAAADGE